MQALQGLQDESQDCKFEKESSHPCQGKGMKIEMHFQILALDYKSASTYGPLFMQLQQQWKDPPQSS